MSGRLREQAFGEFSGDGGPGDPDESFLVHFQGDDIVLDLDNATDHSSGRHDVLAFVQLVNKGLLLPLPLGLWADEKEIHDTDQ